LAERSNLLEGVVPSNSDKATLTGSFSPFLWFHYTTIMVRKRLTKETEAFRVLEHKFEQGCVQANHTPRDIWLSEDVFQEHTLKNFRNLVTKLKVRYGLVPSSVRFNGPSIFGSMTTAQKRSKKGIDQLTKTSVGFVQSNKWDGPVMTVAPCTTSIRKLVDWIPHHWLAVLDETRLQAKAVLAVIQLPSDVKKMESLSINLQADCTELIIKCMMSEIMMCGKDLSVAVLSYNKDRRSREDAITKAMNEQLGDDCKEVWGVFRMQLPFKVRVDDAIIQLAKVRQLEYLYIELQSAQVHTVDINGSKGSSIVDFSDQV